MKMRRSVHYRHCRLDIKFSPGVEQNSLSPREVDILIQVGSRIFRRLEGHIDEDENASSLDSYSISCGCTEKKE